MFSAAAPLVTVQNRSNSSTHQEQNRRVVVYSYHGIRYCNESERSTDSLNRNESHKISKRSQTHWYIMFDSIYKKGQMQQPSPVVSEVRSVLTYHGGGWWPCGYEEGLLTMFFFFWLHHSACGILVPQPGIEPRPSAVKAQSPKHWTAREFPNVLFLDLGADYMAILTLKIH